MMIYCMEPLTGSDERRKVTRRQLAVLDGLHAGLQLTNPISVDVPGDSMVAHAKFGAAGESEVIVHIDPEGFLEQVQVRIVVAGTVSWVPLGNGDTVREWLVNLARQARRTVAPEDNKRVWA